LVKKQCLFWLLFCLSFVCALKGLALWRVFEKCTLLADKAGKKMALSFIKTGIVAALGVAALGVAVAVAAISSSVENTLRACAERFCAIQTFPIRFNPIRSKAADSKVLHRVQQSYNNNSSNNNSYVSFVCSSFNFLCKANDRLFGWAGQQFLF